MRGRTRLLSKSIPSRTVFTGQSHPQNTRPIRTAINSVSAIPPRMALQADGSRTKVSAATTGSMKVRPRMEKDPNPPVIVEEYSMSRGNAAAPAEKTE